MVRVQKSSIHIDKEYNAGSSTFKVTQASFTLVNYGGLCSFRYYQIGYYQISKGIKACATTTQLKRMFLLAGLIRAQKQSPELFLFSELTVREVDLIS